MSRLFPLVPNWTNGLKEVDEFKTDVETTRDGTELRRAMRATPRQTISYDALADRDRWQAFERAMGAGLGATMALPDYTTSVYTTSDLNSGGVSVTLDSIPDWLVEGMDLVVQFQRNIERLSVFTITGSTVTFDSAAVSTWPAGARLRPLKEGRLKPGANSNLITNRVGEVPVEFAITPAIYDADEGVFDFEFSGYLNGREILTLRPNWTTTPQVTHNWTTEAVDYGYGRTQWFQPVAYGQRIFQATYLKKTATDLRQVRKFFRRQKGQRGEFYVPSWSNDMTLQSAVAGDAFITIKGREVYDDYKDDPVHRAIWIRESSGFVHVRDVTGITLSAGNSILAVDELTLDIDPADVESVCWLFVARFATDALTLEWLTNEVGQVVLSTCTLPAATPETAILAELDDAARWLIINFGWKFTESVFTDVLDMAINGDWYEISTGVNPLGLQLAFSLDEYASFASGTPAPPDPGLDFSVAANSGYIALTL